MTNRRVLYSRINPIGAAESVISGLSPTAWYHMRGSGVPTSSGGFASMWPDMADTDNGLVLPGVSGNRASTPASEVFRPSNTVSMRARVRLVDWTPSSSQAICGQYSSGAPAQDGPFFYVNATSGLFGYVAADDSGGIASANSSVAPTVSDGDALWVRVDHDRTAAEVKFYTAPDSTSAPSSWTQLGTTRAVAAITEFNAGATQLFQMGACATGGVAFMVNGTIYRVIDIVDGTTVFDADFASQSKGTTSFTESSSNAATVTVNQSGALPAHIGNKKDLLQGTGTNQPAYSAGALSYDGTDNFMESNAVASMVQPLTRISVLTQDSWTLNDYLYDGRAANSGALYQSATTPDLVGNAGTAMTANGDAPVGTKVIVVSQFNGGSSFTRVNNNANVASAGGAANMLGVSQGASGTPGGYGDVTFYEDVIFESALTDAQIDSVVSALATLNSVTL